MDFPRHTLSHGKDNGQWSGRVQGDSPGGQKSAIWSVFLYYCIAVGGNCIVLYVEVEVAGDLHCTAEVQYCTFYFMLRSTIMQKQCNRGVLNQMGRNFLSSL